ncbi:MAG: TonB-dependent receptor [Panacagrimonas sp.]
MLKHPLLARRNRWFLGGLVLVSNPLLAADEPTAIDTIVVEGQREVPKSALSTAPEALPTQVYVIDSAEVEALPFSDATDLLRQTPGITLGPSSPTGDIGDDLSIRGFSSFHGADAAVYIDGVPVNAPNGPNRHGAVDFNWLTPDLIERIEIVKGPFSALYGNFNLSGAINIITKTSDKSSVSAQAGRYGNYSGSAIYGGEYKGLTPFIAFNYLDRDGYRDRGDYKRVNSFNKVTFPALEGNLSLRFNASFRDYKGNGFLSVDDVRSGAVDRRSATAGSIFDRGKNDYYTAVANYLPKDESGISATAYLGRDEFEFFDTAFNTPSASANPNDNGEEDEVLPTGVTPYEPTSFSIANRTYAGWRVQQTSNSLWNQRVLLTIGTDGQFDDGTVVGGNTVVSGDPDAETAATSGQADDVIANQSRNQQTESLAGGLFAQTQVLVHPKLKLVGGLRYDYFYIDVVNNRFAGTSGDAKVDTVTPKVGAVFTPIPQVEFFANYGGGFRSPAATELSQNRTPPEGQTASFNSSLGVAKLDSADAGVNLRLPYGLQLSGDVFTTTTKRELRRGANAGNSFEVVNVGTTERDGYELLLQWQPLENVRLEIGHVAVDTEIKKVAVAGADRVITVPDDTQTLTASWFGDANGYKLRADLFGQRVGKRPLAADGSLYDDGQKIYGLKGRVGRGPISATLGVDYSPDEFTSDFVFLNGPVIFDPRPEYNVTTGITYVFE